MWQKELDKNKKTNTSWQKVAPWYQKIVGDSGHFYHREVILPNVLRLLNLKPGEKLIDLGCGQGVLARAIPSDIEYAGFDSSSEMIKTAMSLDKNLKHRYTTIDATHTIFWYHGATFCHEVLVFFDSFCHIFPVYHVPPLLYITLSII